ncbi:hypothetical protein V5O48_006110 [Marasmius crinis-equi]|uniref:Uncharacterized protein n=1 Tax=Marasmius crinis-equi TaxID=585013 RepID=A0ABR3FKF7_9AGAR
MYPHGNASQNESQQPQPSQGTGYDSEAEYDDGQIYDSNFLKALDRAETANLKPNNAAAAVPESPSRRKLRVASNAPDYLRQEALRRANMPPATNEAGPSSASSSTANAVAQPGGPANVLSALGLSPGEIAALLKAPRQPTAAPATQPLESPALMALQALLTTYKSTLSPQGPSNAPQQLAAQRSASLPCGAPLPSAPPPPSFMRSASVAPVLVSQPHVPAQLPSNLDFNLVPPSPSNQSSLSPPPSTSDRCIVLENPGTPHPLEDLPNEDFDSSPSDAASSTSATTPLDNAGSSGTGSPSKKQGGRPTRKQAELVANGFKEMDEALYSTASGINADPKSVLNRYLRRFNLGTKKNPWNHYQSWAKSPENVLMEMERLKGTEYDRIYQGFLGDPERRPTVDEMGLTWPLFQAEHGEEKAKDLLAAWNSMCELDAGLAVQTKADRKRVWEGHVRRLHNFLDMLRNVFQMHVFAIGVGGQVNTDAGLHFVYQNYESEGFAESGFLKSIDQLIAFFKTHIYRETKDQYTDQEVVAMAVERGYEVSRSSGSAARSAATAPLSPPTLPQAAHPSSPPAIRPPPVQAAPPAHPAPRLAPASIQDASVAKRGSSGESSGDDAPAKEGEVDVQPILLALAAQCNVSFGKAGSFPWFSLPKECYKRGIQVANFPLRVSRPWSNSARLNRKRGVRGLKIRHQRRLLAAIQSKTTPLLFKSVEAIDLQTDAVPILTYAPGPNGEQKPPVFAKDLEKLEALHKKPSGRKKAAKRPKLETPEPTFSKTPSVPPVATAALSIKGAPGSTGNSNSGTQPKPRAAFKSQPYVQSDDEDELNAADDSEDSDAYGIGLAVHDDDDDYTLTPPGTSSKRKRSSGKSKGKGRADPELTPKPAKDPAPPKAPAMGFAPSKHNSESRPTFAVQGASIPASEFDFQPFNIPGAAAFSGAAARKTGQPRTGAAQAPSLPTVAYASTEPPQNPVASSSVLTAVPRGSGGISGAAGRTGHLSKPSAFDSNPVQAPASLPINTPGPQPAAPSTTLTPQPPNLAIAALLNLLTPEQLAALATLGGAAMANGSQSGGAI